MEQNKVIRLRYKKTQQDRNAVMRFNIIALVNSGYLKVRDESDIEYLTSTLSLIIRFWISEATVSHSRLSVEGQINHYLMMVVRLLEGFATGKGKREIKRFVGVALA